MSAGLADGGRSTTRGKTTVDVGGTWMDQPDASTADRAGMLLLRQDVAALPALFGVGLREFAGLVRQGKFNPTNIDHVLCHYSAEHFRGEIFALLRDADLMIPEERWFTNLHTKGNTGAASIFVMLHEAMAQGRFAPGDRILLIVPESGRFSFAFAQLTCVGLQEPAAPVPTRVMETAPSPLGTPRLEDSDVTRWAVLELAAVWDDFETRLARCLVRRSRPARPRSRTTGDSCGSCASRSSRAGGGLPGRRRTSRSSVRIAPCGDPSRRRGAS